MKRNRKHSFVSETSRTLHDYSVRRAIYLEKLRQGSLDLRLYGFGGHLVSVWLGETVTTDLMPDLCLPAHGEEAEVLAARIEQYLGAQGVFDVKTGQPG